MLVDARLLNTIEIWFSVRVEFRILFYHRVYCVTHPQNHVDAASSTDVLMQHVSL
jgi:hypothetical protein